MRPGIAMLGIALVLPLTPAQAASGRIDWPTFFRVGPSRHDRVVQELLRGTTVDVRACTAQWCEVQYGRTVGYVERGTLAANEALPPAPPQRIGCFDSTRAGYGKGEVFRFCPQ